MNRIVFFTLLVITVDVYGQADSTTVIEYDSTTSISLLSGDTIISATQLDTGFTIKLSDPKAKLLSFSMVYYFDNNGTQGLQVIPFQENRAFIDKKFPKLGLFKDPRSNFITLEHVYFERNGRRYKARGLFLPLK